MKKLFISLLLFSGLAFAQVTDQGIIYSKQNNVNQVVETITMPSFDVEKLKKEDKENEERIIKPFRFGKEFDVNYSPKTHGTWTTLANGDRIWRLQIESKDAITLNFLLDQYQLSPNAKLYLHNENNQFIGYYTANENSKTKQVNTWLIDGSKATVEFYEPKAEIGQSTFVISKVVHGYRSIPNMNPTKGLNTSGHCNVDVNCAAGDNFELQKRAVALILSSSSELCSGTLINNTAQDGTPYFLTANHCINSQTPNWAFRFRWISENPDCATTAPSGDGPRIYTMNGATIIAKNAPSDFALLKLKNDIPLDWDLVLAGWDNSGAVPENVTGMHHPDGDIMKISQYYSSPLATIRQNVAVWEIPDWDLGMTEGGSSGSALFDHNGKIVGQLYGGQAACSGTQSNGKWDGYGRFNVSWEGGGSAATRLKDWLDPSQSGVTTVDHYQFQILANDLQLQSINTNTSCDGEVSNTVKVRNSGSNAVSSFKLNYYFNSENPTTLTWNGSLASNQSVDIEIPSAVQATGVGNFTAEVIYDADENPNNNKRTVEYEVLEAHDTDKVILTLTTDRFASETTWKLFDSNNNVIAQNGTLQANTTHVVEIPLENSGCYRFEIYDKYGDGICCSYGQGSYTLKTAEGTVLAQGASFGAVDSTNFKITSSLGINDQLSRDLAIYPNPTKDIITLDLNSQYGPYEYEIISMTGQKLKAGKANGKVDISMKSFGKGTYFVTLKTNEGKSITKKVMVK
ncbi:T9SS type A sorting domain-containing protein [Vaginella massiliensis]|uniref:T9SS type A sorting domain-containing protein n=1 Tax=Vaginella massiliensis TaxID=1816680 RepID=UPI00374FF1F8